MGVSMEFIEWTGHNTGAIEIFGIKEYQVSDERSLHFIDYGLMFRVNKGDYIIKTLKGRFFAVQRDSFDYVTKNFKDEK